LKLIKRLANSFLCILVYLMPKMKAKEWRKVCSTDNLLQLEQYVLFNKMEQMRVCYLTTKMDPSIVVELDWSAKLQEVAEQEKVQAFKHLCSLIFS